MNLYEKMQTTSAGRHAAALGEAHYLHGAKLGKELADAISAARAYLERLAIEEIKNGETWVDELARHEERSRTVKP